MLIGIFSSFSSLVPLLVWLFGIRRGMHELSYRLGGYIVISALVESINWALVTNQLVENNLPFLHAFTLVEIGLFLWCFAAFIPGLSKRVGALILLVFVGLELILIQSIQPLEAYNSIIRSLESVLFIVLCVIYFFQMIRRMEVEHLTEEPQFWFCAALLFYFSGNLIIFGFSNLMNQTTLIQQVWILHSLLNILLNLLIAVSVWKGLRKTN